MTEAPELKLPQSSLSVFTYEVMDLAVVAVEEDEPHTFEVGSAEVPHALLLCEAVEVVGAGATHASASNESELKPLFELAG